MPGSALAMAAGAFAQSRVNLSRPSQRPHPIFVGSLPHYYTTTVSPFASFNDFEDVP
jgi:hypothetical protein